VSRSARGRLPQPLLHVCRDLRLFCAEPPAGVKSSRTWLVVMGTLRPRERLMDDAGRVCSAAISRILDFCDLYSSSSINPRSCLTHTPSGFSQAGLGGDNLSVGADGGRYTNSVPIKNSQAGAGMERAEDGGASAPVRVSGLARVVLTPLAAAQASLYAREHTYEPSSP
jgi:hypothetical protein